MKRDLRDLKKSIKEINRLRREKGYTQSEKRLMDLNRALMVRHARAELLWSRILKRILDGERLNDCL